MNKNIIIGLMVLLFLLPVVIGVKPGIQESLDGELVIVVPKNEFFPYNNNFTLHFHLFNSTGYQLLASESSCMIHIYSFTNNHLIEESLYNDGNGIDKYIRLNTTIFNTKGLYPYIVACNKTALGVANAGYYSGAFEIATDSLGDVRYDGWTALSLLMIAICFLSLFGASMITEKKLDGLKSLLFLYGIAHTFLLSGVVFVITRFPGRTDFFNTFARGYFTANIIFIVAVILFYMVFLLIRLFGQKPGDYNKD